MPQDKLDKEKKDTLVKSSLEKEFKGPDKKVPRKSKKEKEKEGRTIGPILLVITIIVSILIKIISSFGS